MSAPFAKLPNWAEYGLIPLVNLVVALPVLPVVVLVEHRTAGMAPWPRNAVLAGAVPGFAIAGMVSVTTRFSWFC